MNNSNVTLVESYPFCSENEKFAGAVEVVEIALGGGRKTIGLRLRVGGRFVNLARHRTEEVISALVAGTKEAGTRYKRVLEEMNP